MASTSLCTELCAAELNFFAQYASFCDAEKINQCSAQLPGRGRVTLCATEKNVGLLQDGPSLWRSLSDCQLQMSQIRTSGPNASESPVSKDLCNDLRATLRVLLIRN